MRRLHIIILSCGLAVAVVAAIVVPQFRFTTRFAGRISIANAQVVLPPSMSIKFEPSGTHVDSDGYLKIRLDFYPKPGDKSYDQQHVYVVDETSAAYLKGYKGPMNPDGTPKNQADYDAWWASLPRVWRVNPSICHFVTIPPNLTLAALADWVLQTFNADVTATIDDAASQPNSAHLLSPYMRTKGVVQKELISGSVDKVALANTINTRFASLSVAAAGGGTPETIQPQSIDVGPGATDRNGNLSISNTRVDKTNPANATGTLDTWEFWFVSGYDATAVEAATFYVVSGTNLSTRDSESIGAVTSGSKQTFTSLSTDVSTNDYIGCVDAVDANPQIEATSSAGAGILYRSGDNIPCTNQTFTAYGSYNFSIYATGTEAATFAITNAPGTTIALGTLAVSTSYYAYGSAPSNPVVDGECSQTLTETGGSACDIDIHGHNSTGGGGMTITSSSPGANQFRITAYKSGDNPANGIVITTSDQEFKDNLSASGHFHWDFKFESGSSFTETAQQTTTLALTARAHS